MPEAALAAVASRERWNQKHANGAFGPPSNWVVDHLDLLGDEPRRRALDVASGLGRHALLLAELGFAVDALDISDVGTTRLRQEAMRRGLDVSVSRVDLATLGALPRSRYDVIVNTYFLHRPILPGLAGALAPGGLLIFETFARGQADWGWGPTDARFLLEPGELRRAFARLELVDEREGLIDDGVSRPRVVSSVVVRRPA